MASSFREWPWPLQGLLYVAAARAQLEAAQAEEKPLNDEVASLRVYKQRRAELQSEMDALQKQLATLQTIVPEDKQADQFILMVEREAVSSGVAIRSLTSEQIATKPYYFEMPFQVTADGPYFAVLDFFGRLGRLSRIINIGDLKLAAIAKSSGNSFHMTPGTSVAGSFSITTFFTQSADGKPAGGTTGKH